MHDRSGRRAPWPSCSCWRRRGVVARKHARLQALEPSSAARLAGADERRRRPERGHGGGRAHGRRRHLAAWRTTSPAGRWARPRPPAPGRDGWPVDGPVLARRAARARTGRPDGRGAFLTSRSAVRAGSGSKRRPTSAPSALLPVSAGGRRMGVLGACFADERRSPMRTTSTSRRSPGCPGWRSRASAGPTMTGSWSEIPPRSGISRPAGSKPRTRTWSTPLPPAWRSPAAAGSRTLKSPPKHERRVARPGAQRARRARAMSVRAASGGRTCAWMFAHPRPVASRTACMTRRSGRQAQTSARCSAIGSPRTRIALQPPPQDFTSVRAAARASQRSGGIQLRDVSAERALGTHARRRGAPATTAGPPAAARRPSPSPAIATVNSPKRCGRAAAPRGRGRGSSVRTRMAGIHCQLAPPLPHRQRADARGDLDAMLDRAAALKAAPLSSRALEGRSVALVFQAPSTRTRLSFEAGHLRARRPSARCCARRRCSSRAASRSWTPRGCSPATSRRSACGSRRTRRSRSSPRPPTSRSSTCSPSCTTRARRSPTCSRCARRSAGSRARRSPTSATATTSRARSRCSARSPGWRSRWRRLPATRSPRARWRGCS